MDLIRAKIEANAELSKSMLGSELQGEDFAKKMVDLVNQRKKYFAEERARAKRNKPMTQITLEELYDDLLEESRGHGSYPQPEEIEYGMDGPEDELEKVFWKCLRTMFEEPLSTDPIWSELGQQRIIKNILYLLRYKSVDMVIQSSMDLPFSRFQRNELDMSKRATELKWFQLTMEHTPYGGQRMTTPELAPSVGTQHLEHYQKSRMTKARKFTSGLRPGEEAERPKPLDRSLSRLGKRIAPLDWFHSDGTAPGDNQTTATIISAEGLHRATFTTPPQMVPGTNTTEPPPPPLRNKGPELGADNLTLEGVATELAPSDFVSQNYETLVALMQEETKKRSSQSLQARLNFGPEDEVSPPRHQKERRGKDNRRPPVFGRIGKKVSGTQTANLQNLDTHENNDWRISVRDRLGSRDVHSRLGQRRSSSESPPSSDSEDSRRKRRRRVSSSSEDSSDNEDAETGHWKSKNKYREDEDEDMSRPWRVPETYKIFESAGTLLKNSEQPVWCQHAQFHVFVGTRGTGSTKYTQKIDGFEELRRAFRLNFTQRKKCAKNPVELARVKQRQGESTSAYVERYKDGEAAAANSRKGYSNNRSQEQSKRQSNDQSSSRNNSYRGQRGGRGNDKYTPLTMTLKEILATEGANFPRPPPMRTPEEQHVGNGYCEYHRQKGHTTNDVRKTAQATGQFGKGRRLDQLVKNIKEGKSKQGGRQEKTHLENKADISILVQYGQRKK
ncbi:hypothetical protein Tco_1400823 [Tanacetum coccineum]